MIGGLAESGRPKPKPRNPERDAETFAGAERLLRARNLPAGPLEIAVDGEDNRVVLAPFHVVRMRGAWVYDHRREAASAQEARALGVRAPHCVVAQEDWSIWERLPGTNVWQTRQTSPSFWRGLFRDLSRLHTLPAPLDAPRPNLMAWHADVDRLTALQWDERQILEMVMAERIPPNRLTYGHGDIHGGNLIVAPDGSYGGILDWATGGWWPPEMDYALLEPRGIREAIDAPFEPLDWSLVATLRVGVMVKNHLAGHASLRELQESLGFWQLMR